MFHPSLKNHRFVPETVVSLGVALALAAACCGAPPIPPEPEPPAPPKPRAFEVDAEILSRGILHGNPDKSAVKISHDGKHTSFLAPVDGSLNVWVGPVGDPSAAKPVTHDKVRGVRSYFWAYTNKHIIYLQDSGGDENWHVHVVDLESNTTKDCTPFDNVHATISATSHRFPTEILVGLNNRDPRLHDIHKLNITTGELTLVQENPGFISFTIDHDYNVRYGILSTQDGGKEYLKPKFQDGKGAKKAKGARKKSNGKTTRDVEVAPLAALKEKWETDFEIGLEDGLTTRAVGFDGTGKTLYLFDSRGRNTAAMVTVDTESGEKTVLAEDPLADINKIMIHPTERTIEAVASTYDRRNWQILEPKVAEDFGVLSKVADGDFEIKSRTLDNTQWIVSFNVDDGPERFYLYSRTNKAAVFLFTNLSALEKKTLVKKHPEIIETRDGLKLVNYLSLPPGSDVDGNARPDEPLPMVLDVHGGPWGRRTFGYDARHQWLTNRGYAVLSVNFRGSTGFGKEFINAGNYEWAAKMHDDLIDSVEWAIGEGIARRDKVAIWGGSYGGYATLVGLTFTPEVFACGVDIVGPSNLVTLLSTIPPYWGPSIELFTKRVGDHRTEEGRAFLKERSPLHRVDDIKRPLLIVQGANDPRVKKAESDQIVDAMVTKSIPVTYVLYPDEGHGFGRSENRLSFYAVAEQFLAKCLGGRVEPIGEDFENSTITVPVGVENIPTLKDSLK